MEYGFAVDIHVSDAFGTALALFLDNAPSLASPASQRLSRATVTGCQYRETVWSIQNPLDLQALLGVVPAGDDWSERQQIDWHDFKYTDNGTYIGKNKVIGPVEVVYARRPLMRVSLRAKCCFVNPYGTITDL